jgi:hypothetical protein
MGKTQEEQIEALKDYVKNEVMQQYAEGFKKGLNADDIKFYATIHKERETREEGNNLHAHVIVSRKDMENKIKLSPKTTHRDAERSGTVKSGFDRSEFFNNCEKQFDQKFGYDRDIKLTFEYQNAMKNGSIEQRYEMTDKAIESEQRKEQQQEKEQAPAVEQKQEPVKQAEQAPEIKPKKSIDSQKDKDQDLQMSM